LNSSLTFNEVFLFIPPFGFLSFVKLLDFFLFSELVQIRHLFKFLDLFLSPFAQPLFSGSVTGNVKLPRVGQPLGFKFDQFLVRDKLLLSLQGPEIFLDLLALSLVRDLSFLIFQDISKILNQSLVVRLLDFYFKQRLFWLIVLQLLLKIN
jgi:hypothetical protein